MTIEERIELQTRYLRGDYSKSIDSYTSDGSDLDNFLIAQAKAKEKIFQQIEEKRARAAAAAEFEKQIDKAIEKELDKLLKGFK